MNLVKRLPATYSLLRQRLMSLAFAALMPAVSAQPAHVTLPAPAHGAAAITALGDRLPDVAKAYGLEAQHLVTLFQTQPSLGVDTAGALLVACEGLAVTEHGRLVEGRAKSGNGETADATAEGMAPNSSVTALATGA